MSILACGHWSNSVTRQVSFNWTKNGGKCQNSKIQKFKCDILSNFQTMWLRWCLNFTLVSILKSKLPKASFIRHRQFHADTLMMVLKLLKVHLIPAQKFTCKDLKLKLSEDTFCTCLKPIIIPSVTKVWLLNLTQKYSKSDHSTLKRYFKMHHTVPKVNILSKN